MKIHDETEIVYPDQPLDVLGRLTRAGLRPVTLPSGTRFNFAFVSQPSLIVAGGLASELVDFIIEVGRRRGSDAGIDELLDTAEGMRKGLQIMHCQAAASIREIWDEAAEGWRRVTVSVDDLASFDEGDVQALMDEVRRGSTQGLLTAQIRAENDAKRVAGGQAAREAAIVEYERRAAEVSTRNAPVVTDDG